MAVRMFLALLMLSALAGCSRQSLAYQNNPLCRQAEQRCKAYWETREKAGSDQGAALELLREDCEASQRGCAEGVNRDTEASKYPPPPRDHERGK